MIRKHQISIESFWGPLFSIKCRHSFYQDGVCGDLVFVPTDDTNLLLRNLRLLFKAQKDGFSVLYNQSKAAGLLSSSFLKDARLTFQVFNTNARLINFTDLPLEYDGALYAFSNGTDYSRDKRNFIHPGSHVASETKERIPWRPRSFSVEFKNPVAYEEVKILDVHGGEVPKRELSAERSKVKNTLQPVDLTHLPDGRYRIKAKGEKDFEFYATRTPLENLFGMLDIYLAGVPAGYAFYDKQKVNPQEYFIQLQSRPTYWKYILIRQEDGKNGKSGYSEARITWKGEEIGFSKPAKIVLNDGTEAIFVESLQPMPLRQTVSSSEKLEMKLKKDNKWLTKSFNLPLPDIDVVKPDKATGKVYSVIYVYL